VISQYNWSDGPALIAQHSIAKHRILQSYLAAYFATLVGGQPREEFKLTLVDGFAGGGLYYHQDTRQLIKGSPFIFLQAEEEGRFRINQGRTKPVRLDITHFFIESDRDAYLHLDKALRDEGFASRIGASIQLRNAKFEYEVRSIVEAIKKKSPRNGRSIFALDQFGYGAVPTSVLRYVLDTLPGAEIILTFGVDALLNYANDKNFAHSLANLEVPDILAGRSINDIKKSERDWRLFIQSSLYSALVESCGARHFTPFFIRNRSGHGDYWLIHMAQHHRARDVMTDVHWQNHTSFIHYGGAGLDMFNMLGYDPRTDATYHGQSELGFEFDTVARQASVRVLMEQIPRLVHDCRQGVPFKELYANTCNHSPATAGIYRDALAGLVAQNALEIASETGGRRRAAAQIKFSDRINTPRQRILFT
jgi:three-Cys-motif partner protein